MYHMLLLPALPPHPPRESVARMRAHPATRGLAVEELDEVTRGLCVMCVTPATPRPSSSRLECETSIARARCARGGVARLGFERCER